MKKQFIVILVTLALPFGASAQLSKLMSKYHEQNCVTVTQLDKSLYGLYQKSNLPAEAEEMLRKLDEVNLLNLNLNSCSPETGNKVATQFREVLNDPDKYKLIKSHSDEFGKQLIYSQNKNGKISDLVVWNQNPERLDIIELRGDIQLDKIALLSKVLNLKGLNSLAALSSNPDSYQSYKHSNDYLPNNSMQSPFRQMQQMAQSMHNQFGGGFGDIMNEFFGVPNDSIRNPDHFFSPFGDMGFLNDFFDPEMKSPDQIDEFFKQQGGGHQKIGSFFQSFGDGENVIGNSVQITEENGKTKIKIDSKNSDMTYIIDGKKVPKDNVQMPDKILNVNIIPSKEDIKKSYLFITSKEKIGDFVSYKNGVLTFKYDNQEYKYNPDKMQEPLLVVNGRLSATFDIEPSEILQIRPISQIEKEIGYYPNAAVIINTK